MDADEFWAKRFDHFDDAARTLLDKTLQLVGIAITFLSAAAALALAYSRYEVLLFVPFIMLVVWAIAARLLHEQLLLSAYRDHADEMLSGVRDMASKPLVWHSFGGSRIRNGFANRYLFFALGTASVALIAGSVALSFITSAAPLPVLIVEAAIVAFGLALGGYAFSRVERDVGEVYEQAVPNNVAPLASPTSPDGLPQTPME